ncbi:MAG: DUF502 domain-containing protein [Halorhabdus sp.]
MSPLSERSPPRPTDIRDRLKQSLFTGLAITIPLLVTLVVISFVAGFVFGTLEPLANVLGRMMGPESGIPQIALEVVAVSVVVLAILVVGFIAESRPSDGTIEARFDRAMGNIPGVGTVYRTFDEMSEIVMDADTESFQEVKLVEFPTQHSYALGFVTAETPERIEAPTGSDEMLTLYVPMSPNPVMGGYVIYVPKDRCVDVDLSVEEGIKSIMTSGVSLGESSTQADVQSVFPDAESLSIDLPTMEERDVITETGGPDDDLDSGDDRQ